MADKKKWPCPWCKRKSPYCSKCDYTGYIKVGTYPKKK